MKKLVIIGITLLLGCTNPDEIPFNSGESVLVVEGWLTNQAERQYVRISRTVPFTANQKNEIISGARVRVQEFINTRLQQEFEYTYDQNGYYRSGFIQGLAGNSYRLIIELPNGEIIQSGQELMQSVTPVDSLGYDFFLRDSEENPSIELTIYYPIAWTSDPAEVQNYYRWKMYRNDTLFSQPDEIFLFNDRFINGNQRYRQEFTMFEYSLLDTVRAERLAISKNAFDFLSQLKAQTTSLGTNTAVSPAAVRGNLTNLSNGELTLGYFGTTSLTSSEVIITD